MMDVFSTKLKDYCREITRQEKTSADLAMCSDKLNTRQEVLQKNIDEIQNELNGTTVQAGEDEQELDQRKTQLVKTLKI